MMTQQRRQSLSRIMHMAWAFYRTAQQELEARTFGDCLRGAWSLSKRLAEAAAKMPRRGHLRFSPTLFRSPIARACGSDRVADHRAAYVTARLGG